MTRSTALVSALALLAATTVSARHASRYDARYDARYGEAPGPRWDTARVVNVDPILAPGEPSYRQQCWQEPVRYVSRDVAPAYERPYGRRSGVGQSTSSVLGGIVGAAIGHQIGDGDGQRAATVAGALLGSAIARDSYRERERYADAYGDAYGRGYTVERETVRYEQRCQNVPAGYAEDRVVGYRVDYDYQGHRYTTQTPYHPGSTIRVRVDVVPEL